ncbi:MAG: hypothetical protein AAF578_08815 [Pseudomonadota bacterium]
MSFLSELKRRNVIRVATVYAVGTWLVLQVVDVLAGILSLPDWTLRFVLLVAALGFPFVLVFSWVYELTPEGIRRETEVEPGDSVTSATAHKLNLTIIGLLCLTIALLLVNQFWYAPSSQRTEAAVATDLQPNSIAVLPFDNFSSDPQNAYLASGLTETLITMLSSANDLRVAGETSAFATDARKSTTEIARELGVAYVLRGSVQKAGETLRVTANLIDSRNSNTVWSEKFDKPVDEIFAIQDEITDSVFAIVVSEMLGIAQDSRPQRIGTTDVTAFDLYLRAVNAARPGSFEALETAEQLLSQALSRDANFVEALIEMSSIYLSQIATGLRPPTPGFSEAADLAARALAQRPDSADAAILELEARSRADLAVGIYESTTEIAEEALAILNRSPNSLRVIMSYAGYLEFDGEDEQALALLQRAALIDPKNPRVFQLLGGAYANTAQYGESRAAFRKSLDLEEAQPNIWASIANLDYRDGNHVGFIKNYKRAMEFDPQDPELPFEVAATLYRMDFVEAGDEYLGYVRDIDENSPSARILEVERALALGETETVQALTRQLIEDGVENRNDAFSSAVFNFVLASSQLSQLEGALAFLESRYPEFSDPYREGVPPKIGSARAGIEVLLLSQYSEAQAKQQADKLRVLLAAFRIEVSETRIPQAVLFLLENDIEGAIAHYRDTILPSRPFRTLRHPERIILSLDVSRPLLEDAAIRKGLEVWNSGLESAREEVARYLASNDSAI